MLTFVSAFEADTFMVSQVLECSGPQILELLGGVTATCNQKNETETNGSPVVMQFSRTQSQEVTDS